MASGLTSIGTGLTGFMEGFQKARQEAALNALRQLTIQQSQQQDQANSAAWAGLPALLGQGGGLPSSPMPGQASTPNAPTFPGGGDFDTAPPSYASSPAAGVGTGLSARPTGGGGGYSPSGSSFTSGLKALTDLGLSPEYASAATSYMSMNESPQGAQSLNPSSGAYGRAQWLGPRKAALTSQYGPQPNDEQQAKFMTAELQGSERGTLDKLLAAQAAGKPPEEAYRIWGQSYERPGAEALQVAFRRMGSLPSVAQSLMREVHTAAGPEGTQEATQTANAAGQQLAQLGGQGRQSLANAAAAIEAANPNASPAVKFMALSQISKLLAPSDRTELSLLLLQQKQDFAKEMQQEREKQQKEMQGLRDETGKNKGFQIVTGPDGIPRSVNPNTGEVKQLDLDAGTTRLGGRGGTGVKGSKNIEVVDGEGKVVFSGAAHQTAQGWVSDKDQKPVQVPDDGNIKISGTAGPGRAVAQIQSMIGSSEELVGEVKNLMELPSSAVAGVFQGLQGQPASALGEAVKRTLANKITPEEQNDLAVSFQGVSRALATIEAQGRATGLVGLTAMSQGLMPQTGDTLGTMLRKYATLRQIMERNTTAILASPSVSDKQKAELLALNKEMAQIVPFTVSEVNKLQHGDAESVAQAAKRFGLAGQPETAPSPGSPAAPGMRPPPAKYLEGDVIVNPQTNEKLYYRNGKWEPL